MSRLLTWATGAKKEEQGRVFLTFLALLCLLISYYLIKPLRNSTFLKEFHPSQLPFFYASVAFLSFSATKVFSHLAKTVEKYRLVKGAYITIICCKLGLSAWLSFGGKTAVVCFYFFASVYFLLAVATMWACINDMFTPEQSERCFGFVAVGSTFGSISGSNISRRLAESAYSDMTLYCSVLFMLCALGFVMLAAQREQRRIAGPEDDLGPKDDVEIDIEDKGKEIEIAYGESESSEGADFWEELRALTQRPYIRRIGLTVLLLAVLTTAIEFVSQTVIDRELAKEQYQSHFADLEGADFHQIYNLKTKSKDKRREFLSSLAQAGGVTLPEMQDRFEDYRKELEKTTRSFFSETYEYQGWAGVLSLLVVARFLFSRVGMRYCFTILPVLGFASLCLFGLPIDLLLVQIVLVLVGATNYSLNNAAKEILYTATDEKTLFRFKPMIEGPAMRAGDVVSSVLKLGVGAVAASLALSEASETNLFVVVTLVVLVFWIRAAWLAGAEYDQMRKVGEE